MKTYAYSVIGHTATAEFTCSTNGIYETIEQAIAMMSDDSIHTVDIIDGYTGEVLLAWSANENLYWSENKSLYCTDEMGLMLAGWDMINKNF